MSLISTTRKTADANLLLSSQRNRVVGDDHSVGADIVDSGESIGDGIGGTGGIADSMVSVRHNTTVASATANERTKTLDASGANGALSSIRSALVTRHTSDTDFDTSSSRLIAAASV